MKDLREFLKESLYEKIPSITGDEFINKIITLCKDHNLKEDDNVSFLPSYELISNDEPKNQMSPEIQFNKKLIINWINTNENTSCLRIASVRNPGYDHLVIIKYTVKNQLISINDVESEWDLDGKYTNYSTFRCDDTLYDSLKNIIETIEI